MLIKAKDLKVGMKVVVREFGQKSVHELTYVKEFPRLHPNYGSAFIAVKSTLWEYGVLGLGSTLNLDEEIEIEE